tara:strand:+ start:44 stop:247 length:204 start_codon:yes stop_codon:yes gene_type:complete
MGTIGAQGLRRSSLSSKRSRQSVKTIEAYLGKSIGRDTSDNTASKETSSKQELGDNNERSLDKTNKR